MTMQSPRPESEAHLKPFLEAARGAMKVFDFAEAERQYRAAIAEAERLDPPDPLALAQVLEGLAGLGALNQRIGTVPAKGATMGGVSADEAEALRQRARSLVEEAAGSDSPAMAEHLAAEGTTLLIRGRSAEAEEHLKRALALAEKDAENGRRLTAILSQLALISMQTGRADEAEATLRRAVATARTLTPRPGDGIAPPSLSPSGPVALVGALGLLASLYNREGRYQDAEAAAREAVALGESLPERPSQLFSAYYVLATALRRQWRIREAWHYHRRAMAMERERWAAWGWGTQLTMAFAHLLMFLIAPRIKPSTFPRE